MLGILPPYIFELYREQAGCKASRIQGVVTEHYLYDGIHVVADTDNSGNLLRTYTYGPGVDDILAMTIHGSGGTTNYYYLKDLANTVLALANSSGSIVESYVYDAYGNVTIKNGSGTVIPVSAYGNRFLFLGREYDYTTQLYHFRARWYDPETGRWLSNDPIGISGGLNLYAFCANNPVCFVDPMGLSWDVVVAYVSGFAEGAIGGAAVMLDGAIPFADPFSCAYTDSCGSVDSAYGPSLFCSDVANAAIPFGPGKLRLAGSAQKFFARGTGIASSKCVKEITNKVKKDLGRAAQRELHDMKECGGKDRSYEEILDDVIELYRKYGKKPPSWIMESLKKYK